MQDSIQLTDKWLVMGGLRYDAFDVYAGKAAVPDQYRQLGQQAGAARRGGLQADALCVAVQQLYRVVQAELFHRHPNWFAAAGAGQVVEVGGKLALPNGVTGTLALFDITKRNVMVSELVEGETVTRTAGRVRSQGVELDVAGNLTDSLSLIGSYAYTDARVVDDPDNKGKEMTNVARHTASLFLTQNLGSPGLYSGDEVRIGAGARYVGRRPGDAANSFYRIITPLPMRSPLTLCRSTAIG